MKRIIKKIIPTKLLNFIRILRLIFKYWKYYYYDFIRFVKYSNTVSKYDSKEKILGALTTNTHIVEKGLTMPEMRIGFGQSNISTLIDLCEIYARTYDSENERFIQCVSVIKEYHNLHIKEGFSFEESFNNKLNSFTTKYIHVETSQQISTNTEEFFEHRNSSFDQFAYSRHSFRSFSGIVDEKSIHDAISLAMTAPSACNKQGQRVYVIKDESKKKEVIGLINGGRGFADLADKFILITSENAVWSNFKAYKAGHFDSGIFTMNLLYALHFYKIGACVLNTQFTPQEDMKFRSKIGVKKSEDITCLIAIGGFPENFKIAHSKRIDANSIIRMI